MKFKKGTPNIGRLCVDGRPSCPAEKCTKNVSKKKNNLIYTPPVINNISENPIYKKSSSLQYSLLILSLSLSITQLYAILFYIEPDTYGTWADSCHRNYLFSKEKVNALLRIYQDV
jgi:hypothetical protein